MADSKADVKTEQELDDIPEAFICPITQTLMRDPYIDADGNSYEKDAIMEWLKGNLCSPITRNALNVNQLVPNRVLRGIIDDYRVANGLELQEAKRIESKPMVMPVELPPIDRKPLLLFTLIDVSGSMGIACGQNATGESDGYNRMDLVKHTLNTIITSLTDHDKICIIKFSTVAEMFCQPTFCTDANKTALIGRVKNIQQEGQTNIWDALRLCLDNISEQGSYADQFNTEVYLLTDGEPNINPPQPIVDTMKNYMRLKLKDVTNKPKISTFGYGYNLDSKLCFDLSQVSNGTFGFIPDSTMVGTVFINALSQTLVGTNYEFEIEASDAKDAEDTESSAYDTVIRKAINMLDQCASISSRAVPDQNVVIDFCTYITSLKNELYDKAGEEKTVQFLSDLIIDCSDSDDANLGQIFKATNSEFFSKWGKHYLLSVLSAFKRRMCINFKDKAMQNFRTEKFMEEQQRIEDVFIQLPAPTPSCTNTYYNGNYGSATVASTPVNMTSYYNSGGGCFTANSKVFVLHTDNTDSLTKITLDLQNLHNNPLVKLVSIADLRKGMLVLSAMVTESMISINTTVSFSKVETIVRLPFDGDLHQIGALTLTPYHPILIGKKTAFPIESSSSIVIKQREVTRDAGWVYDLVLANRGLVISTTDDGSSLIAATWGHSCSVGIFQHAYFGSEEIINDLKELDANGYDRGFVCLNNNTFRRDPNTMAVQALQSVVVESS